MIVVATFENHLFVELAISALRQKGIAPHHLFAVPLDRRTEPPQLLDSIHRADGFSSLDLAAIFGTCFMLLGSIYGYVLTWGPIIWGIIGAVGGIGFGLLLKWWLNRKTARRQTNMRAEIVLLIRCDETQWPMIERLLWDHHALGLAGIRDGKAGGR
ncbi:MULTISPECIES: hypothetical protein [Geobacillus]|uniref:hypothetical protein n=1 Tax=Geobacillus TaxID=129337 RepID=UPI0009BE082D|nr:hypothetical protein [Geobacillus sp. 46C-IIa]OQP07216.1 hypothetical protein B1690_04810 [Geobacillus sp. 46C-IIa]QNU29541.1 hypothetical protein IC803_08660 [Geobacillus sp. 46C-IIa]